MEKVIPTGKETLNNISRDDQQTTSDQSMISISVRGKSRQQAIDILSAAMQRYKNQDTKKVP